MARAQHPPISALRPPTLSDDGSLRFIVPEARAAVAAGTARAAALDPAEPDWACIPLLCEY
jgi:hypothetical protein